MIENYSQNLINFFKDLDYSLLSMVSSKNKPYKLTLEKLYNFDKDKWIKMVCCIPNEYHKYYKNQNFIGNIFTGLNKKLIIKEFNLNFFG